MSVLCLAGSRDQRWDCVVHGSLHRPIDLDRVGFSTHDLLMNSLPQAGLRVSPRRPGKQIPINGAPSRRAGVRMTGFSRMSGPSPDFGTPNRAAPRRFVAHDNFERFPVAALRPSARPSHSDAAVQPDLRLPHRGPDVRFGAIRRTQVTPREARGATCLGGLPDRGPALDAPAPIGPSWLR
jgi:hypothetical protein